MAKKTSWIIEIFSNLVHYSDCTESASYGALVRFTEPMKAMDTVRNLINSGAVVLFYKEEDKDGETEDDPQF